MTPDQYIKFLDLLEQIVSRQYTISGAADWPMVLVIGSILVAVIGFMWRDLRMLISGNKKEWQIELQKHEIRDAKALEDIWAEMHRCKSECCSRKKEE